MRGAACTLGSCYSYGPNYFRYQCTPGSTEDSGALGCFGAPEHAPAVVVRLWRCAEPPRICVCIGVCVLRAECDASCATCSGPDADQCTSCPAGNFLNGPGPTTCSGARCSPTV